jgi:hypothetical protein
LNLQPQSPISYLYDGRAGVRVDYNILSLFRHEVSVLLRK